MTVDTTQLKQRALQCSREIGFSKMIYQLLMKFGRKYGSHYHLHCYLYDRTTRQPLEEVREMLNNGLRKRWGIENRPIRRLQFAQTEDEPALQINDVLLGALAHRSNGHHTALGAAAHKCALSAHVLKRAGISNPLCNTAFVENRFTTWMFRLQDRRGSERS
jgi:diketogulonate reductase-like aldo/keto reductase